jgi:hypothetical protein
MSPADKPVCPTCNGSGYMYNDETFTRIPCDCKIAEYMTTHLGTEIARAKSIYSSPLMELADVSGTPPKLDRTRENLHIKSTWIDLLPHLKLCLWVKGIFFNFRVVTDEKIKTVFVGAESYNQRAKSKRDDMATMNSLNDLIGPEYDFVVVRLGFLGHKNVAAPGAVKEALMVRDVARKPTWIVEEPASPFGPGNYTYSDDLAEYIDRHYKTIAITGTSSRAVEYRGFAGAEEVVGGVEDVSPSEPVVRPTKARVTPPTSTIGSGDVGSSDDADLPGEGRSQKWKPTSKWKPKNRGGGGDGGGPLG